MSRLSPDSQRSMESRVAAALDAVAATVPSGTTPRRSPGIHDRDGGRKPLPTLGTRVRLTAAILVLAGAAAGLKAVVIGDTNHGGSVDLSASGQGGPDLGSSASPPTTREAASPAWRQRGEDIRAAKRERDRSTYPDVVNDADFAYPSRPVDITQPGTYTFYFGPVEDWFAPPNPVGWGNYWPSDVHFNIRPVGSPEVVVLDDQRYLKIDYQVREESFRPYLGLYGWIG